MFQRERLYLAIVVGAAAGRRADEGGSGARFELRGVHHRRGEGVFADERVDGEAGLVPQIGEAVDERLQDGGIAAAVVAQVYADLGVVPRFQFRRHILHEVRHRVFRVFGAGIVADPERVAVVSVFVEAGGLFGGGGGFAFEEGKLRCVHLLAHQRFDGGGVLRALRVREGHLRPRGVVQDAHVAQALGVGDVGGELRLQAHFVVVADERGKAGKDFGHGHARDGGDLHAEVVRVRFGGGEEVDPAGKEAGLQGQRAEHSLRVAASEPRLRVRVVQRGDEFDERVAGGDVVGIFITQRFRRRLHARLPFRGRHQCKEVVMPLFKTCAQRFQIGKPLFHVRLRRGGQGGEQQRQCEAQSRFQHVAKHMFSPIRIHPVSSPAPPRPRPSFPRSRSHSTHSG